MSNQILTKKESQTIEERRRNGQCIGCGSSDYTQVCDRGKPRHGPDGLYCDPCFIEADTSPFGESPFDH